MTWLGCSHVAPEYNQGTTLLQTGVDTLADLGFTTVRLWMSGNYSGLENGRPDYAGQTWGSVPTNLTQLAQTSPFVTVFSDVRVQRYCLGTWTFASGIGDTWRAEAFTTYLAAEYTELYNLCVHLLSTYSNKDFILQTVETDWTVINYSSDVAVYDGRNYIDPKMLSRGVAFLDARNRAVRDARQAVPGATSRVFSCIETARVLDNQPRVHSHIIPRALPDMISWTCYEATSEWAQPGATQASVEAAIVSKTTEAVRRMRAEVTRAHGDVAGANIPIIVGEYGNPERHALLASPSSFDVAAMFNVFYSTCVSLGVYGINYWQLWDNDTYPGTPNYPQGRYLYDENGTLSVQGAAVLGHL